VRHEWVARSVHRPGELMRVRSGAEVLSGRFAGFGDDGRLLLEVDGARREFLAAELIVDLEG
jgi:biotin-(acetyl-CoA carboxylase) ligase